MLLKDYRIIAVTGGCALAAFASCGRGPVPGAPESPFSKERRPDVALLGDGWIKVGGGCVAYYQAEIHFRPRPADQVEMELDNRRSYFWRDGRPLPSYTRDVPAADAVAFFADVKEMCGRPRPEPWPSTGAATMEVHLPLNAGTVEGRFAEAHDKKDRDPLLARIRGFVVAWAPPGERG